MQGIVLHVKRIVDVPQILAAIARLCHPKHVTWVKIYNGNDQTPTPHLWVLVKIRFMFPFAGCHSREELEIVEWYSEIYALRSVYMPSVARGRNGSATGLTVILLQLEGNSGTLA